MCNPEQNMIVADVVKIQCGTSSWPGMGSVVGTDILRYWEFLKRAHKKMKNNFLQGHVVGGQGTTALR